MNPPVAAAGLVPALGASDVEQRITDWLRAYLSDLLSIPAEQINDSTALQRYGLDSSAAVGLAGDLGDWLGYDLDATITYDHPSIAALAAALARDEKLLAALGRPGVHPEAHDELST